MVSIHVNNTQITNTTVHRVFCQEIAHGSRTDNQNLLSRKFRNRMKKSFVQFTALHVSVATVNTISNSLIGASVAKGTHLIRLYRLSKHVLTTSIICNLHIAVIVVEVNILKNSFPSPVLRRYYHVETVVSRLVHHFFILTGPECLELSMRMNVSDDMIFGAVLFYILYCIHQIVRSELECAAGAKTFLKIQVMNVNGMLTCNLIHRYISNENTTTLVEGITMNQRVDFLDNALVHENIYFFIDTTIIHMHILILLKPLLSEW